jgi:hypothetical protein
MKPSQQPELKKELKKYIKSSLRELEPDFIDTLKYNELESSSYNLGNLLFDILSEEYNDYILSNDFDNMHNKSEIKITKENIMFLFIDNISKGFES